MHRPSSRGASFALRRDGNVDANLSAPASDYHDIYKRTNLDLRPAARNGGRGGSDQQCAAALPVPASDLIGHAVLSRLWPHRRIGVPRARRRVAIGHLHA